MHMFRNDYSEGAAPQILEALTRTNEEQCVGYTEGDPHCERARELMLKHNRPCIVVVGLLEGEK